MHRIKGRVKPATWEAFQLTAIEGLSGADAAHKLGIPVAHVFVAKHRVQKMLQEEVRHPQEWCGLNGRVNQRVGERLGRGGGAGAVGAIRPASPTTRPRSRGTARSRRHRVRFNPGIRNLSQPARFHVRPGRRRRPLGFPS